MNVIIVGGVKTAYFLARQFMSKGYSVTLIDRDPEEGRVLSRQLQKPVVIVGDGSDPAVLEAAGARQADALLALTPYDQDNLIACQIAKQMYGVPRAVALINDPDNEPVFRQLGINVTFNATRILAMLIEEQTDWEDIANLIPVGEGRIQIVEVTLHEDSPALGQTLQSLPLPEGALIAGILRGEDVIVPKGASRLQLDDRVVLISQSSIFAKALRTLTGKTP